MCFVVAVIWTVTDHCIRPVIAAVKSPDIVWLCPRLDARCVDSVRGSMLDVLIVSEADAKCVDSVCLCPRLDAKCVDSLWLFVIVVIRDVCLYVQWGVARSSWVWGSRNVTARRVYGSERNLLHRTSKFVFDLCLHCCLQNSLPSCINM